MKRKKERWCLFKKKGENSIRELYKGEKKKMKMNQILKKKRMKEKRRESYGLTKIERWFG